MVELQSSGGCPLDAHSSVDFDFNQVSNLYSLLYLFANIFLQSVIIQSLIHFRDFKKFLAIFFRVFSFSALLINHY